MNHTLSQLRQALWQAENGASGEGQDFNPQADRIDTLVASLREFELGDIDITGLREVFAWGTPKGFNLEAFIQDQIEAGNYRKEALEPWPDEEPEDLGSNVVPIR
ncbi:hypothetical protein KY389_01835 [Paracoccus bogoriensis]|uniref:hypothetical protein n=1 Tax=Paracoccus bogoriensis TaxID=242065 RepID=UPI001CA5D67E|nr:hypothetical protein [Paracoccus bogoriensis]MBW7055435.1 hypothetical protein [Paracoccus bogoriensis]